MDNPVPDAESVSYANEGAPNNGFNSRDRGHK